MLMRKLNFKTSSVLGVFFKPAVRQVARMSYENTVTWSYIGHADVGEGCVATIPAMMASPALMRGLFSQTLHPRIQLRGFVWFTGVKYHVYNHMIRVYILFMIIYLHVAKTMFFLGPRWDHLTLQERRPKRQTDDAISLLNAGTFFGVAPEAPKITQGR